MDVGVGFLPGAVLIHDHGALKVQLVIEAGEVHQGAGVAAVLQEHVLQEHVLQGQVFGGHLDLAVAGIEGKYRGMALREFYREEVMLFAAGGLLESCFGRDMPRVAVELERGNLSALERCPFVLGTPRDIAGRIAQEVLEEAVIRPEIAVRVENLEILLDLCARGVGCCFCPTVLARTALSEEKFRSLYKVPLGEKGRYSIRFGYRDRGRVWGVLEAFMDIAAGTVGGR